MTVIIRHLGLQQYIPCWRAMQEFTQKRHEKTDDEIWLLEHPSVFTQGQNGKAEHILQPGDIPIIPIDRGGQITYHGPGQSVAYILLDLKRKKFNVRELVTRLETAVVHLLAKYDITAYTKRTAPGIYVGEKKICSLGLRIRRGCSYHGIALNVNMNLEPFSRINPCGFAQLKMTQVAEFIAVDIKTVELQLMQCLVENLGYTNVAINQL